MAAKEITFLKIGKYWPLYFLVLPSAAVVGTFAYFPAFSAIYHAFFRWNGDFINEFAGLGNFYETFHDRILWKGFGVIGILIIANLFKMIPSIITAIVINRLYNPRAGYFYKVMFVIPMIIPEMVWLLMWKFFYDPSSGILNTILRATGILPMLWRIDTVFNWGVFPAGTNPVWLGDANLIIPSIIFWGFPWVGIVGVLIYLAGLQSIDESVYEAAAIDGITSLKKLLYIEIPLIMSQIRINLVLMIIATLQGYGLMLILFGASGGPQGIALVPGLYMYSQAFTAGRAGYACAIGFIMFIFILILTELNNRFVRVEK
jgi:ABC-type sugar transport system permease subunit